MKRYTETIGIMGWNIKLTMKAIRTIVEENEDIRFVYWNPIAGQAKAVNKDGTVYITILPVQEWVMRQLKGMKQIDQLILFDDGRMQIFETHCEIVNEICKNRMTDQVPDEFRVIFYEDL